MEPLFVLGCPRSGTTFLSQLVQYTPYGKPVESHFITKYYHEFPNVHVEVDEGFLSDVVNRILKERAIMQWKLNINAEEFVKQLPEKSYRCVVDSLFKLRFSRLGCEMWSDKTPNYVLNFHSVYDLFPDAKYIFIIRDGRDVALSLLSRQWGPNNIYSCADYWVRSNEWYDEFNRIKEKNRFFIHYEDLLDNIEDRTRKLYDFLEIDYPEPEVNKIISNVMSGNYNKWKNVMTKRQVKVFESVAGQTLARFGYDVSNEQANISIFSSYFYQFHDFILRLKFLFVINVIDGIKIKFLGKQPFAE